MFLETIYWIAMSVGSCLLLWGAATLVLIHVLIRARTKWVDLLIAFARGVVLLAIGFAFTKWGMLNHFHGIPHLLNR